MQATLCQAVVQLLLVLLALNCFMNAVQCQAVWPPVQRKIVDDLTPILLQQLQQANISEWAPVVAAVAVALAFQQGGGGGYSHVYAQHIDMK
jgi:hypothetical protein